MKCLSVQGMKRVEGLIWKRSDGEWDVADYHMGYIGPGKVGVERLLAAVGRVLTQGWMMPELECASFLFFSASCCLSCDLSDSGVTPPATRGK